jgi:hypothetical protein
MVMFALLSYWIMSILFIWVRCFCFFFGFGELFIGFGFVVILGFELWLLAWLSFGNCSLIVALEWSIGASLGLVRS